MTYWRMQLHPNHREAAVRYTVESLAAGYIGLGFNTDPGDLTKLQKNEYSGGQQDYLRFAHEMEVGDPVLIITHHFPFAVAEVEGEYNYIRNPVSDLGVWFRHFRAVTKVRYYGDHQTNSHESERLTMTNTISPLRDPDSKSYRLIREMCSAS